MSLDSAFEIGPSRVAGRRLSVKAWRVETHDGQVKLWYNRIDNQRSRFCVQDCRSFHVEEPITFGARFTCDAPIEPVSSCRSLKCGMASRRDTSIGSDSCLLQGYSVCLLLLQTRQLRLLSSTYPLAAAVRTLAPQRFKSTRLGDVLRFGV